MDEFLGLGVDYGSTDVLADVLTDDLADDRCQTQCFCFCCVMRSRMPERCCSASPLHVTCTARYLLPLCAHCSAAQVQLVVLCNHRIRLHCLHLAWAAQAGLAWVEEFKLHLSLCVS